MGVMSDKGLDLQAVSVLAGELETLAHLAQYAPDTRDREEARALIQAQGAKLAKYFLPTDTPTAPDWVHRDSDGGPL